MLKVVEHKLSATRAAVHKEWQRYSKVKKKILSSRRGMHKKVIASELDLTRTKIANKWTDYREVKYSLIHKSPYKGFKFIRTLTGVHKEVYHKEIDPKTGKRTVIVKEIDPKTGKNKIKFFKFHDSHQKIYKARKGFDVDRLDEVVPKILSNPKVRGVLVVFEVYDVETETTKLVSNWINKEEIDIIQELNETTFEYVSKAFQGGDTKIKKLKFIYMRVVYEKA